MPAIISAASAHNAGVAKSLSHHFKYSKTAAAAPALSPEDEARERVSALRFRTEPCRTFTIDGVCPYEDKCMFAHGPKTLRTREMNEADGLISEAAIRAWMYRRRRQAARRAAVADARRKAKEAKMQSSTNDDLLSDDHEDDVEPCTIERIRSVRRCSNDTQDTSYGIEARGLFSGDDEHEEAAVEDDDEPAVPYDTNDQSEPDSPCSGHSTLFVPSNVVIVPASVVFVRAAPGWYRRDPYALTSHLQQVY